MNPVTKPAIPPATPQRPRAPKRVPVAMQLNVLAGQVRVVHDNVERLMAGLAETDATNAQRIEASREVVERRLDENAARIELAEKRMEDTDARIDRERASTDARLDRIDRELVQLAQRSERWGRLAAGTGGFLCVLGLVANDFPVLHAVARALAVVVLGGNAAPAGS